MKKKHKSNKQNIIVSHSKLYHFIEKSLLFFHIFLLVITIVTFLGFLVNFPHDVELAFEIITVLLIFTVVLLAMLQPIIIKYYVRKILGPFWGEHIIETKIFRLTKLERAPESIFTSIKEADVAIAEERINIRWKNGLFSSNKLHMNAEISGENGKIFKFKFLIKFIIVNIGEGRIVLNAKLKNTDTDEIENRSFLLNFNPNKQRALWSGLLPNHPNFGEWVWESISKEEEIEENESLTDKKIFENEIIKFKDDNFN